MPRTTGTRHPSAHTSAAASSTTASVAATPSTASGSPCTRHRSSSGRRTIVPGLTWGGHDVAGDRWPAGTPVADRAGGGDGHGVLERAQVGAGELFRVSQLLRVRLHVERRRVEDAVDVLRV